MAVISIIGCAGVGKSTLVRQLAALNRAPAFFEGEEGVFPEVVTKNLVTADPVARERWFVQQYLASLRSARHIASLGVTSFVDNASPITIASYAAIAEHEVHVELEALIAELARHAADVTVVLTAEPHVLAAYIAKRGRVSEEVVSISKQAERVQEQFVRFAEQYGAMVLDRTGLDLQNEVDLWEMDARIKNCIQEKIDNTSILRSMEVLSNDDV